MDQLLQNHIIGSLSWSNVTVTIPERQTKKPRNVVHNVSGDVQAGEMLAIMGPSGSGKTTLLNVLAHRPASPHARISSKISINDQVRPISDFQSLSRFVESEDTLLGALTVRETLYFAAQLGLGSTAPRPERDLLIEELIHAFGLAHQTNALVGTLVRRGLSTGEKRRLSIASHLITSPKVLFLDEPTSGLDSTASFKVMSYLRDVAKSYKLLIICSVHQPSSAVFDLFEKVLLMTEGKPCYMGRVDNIRNYLDTIGYPVPLYINTAEYVLDLINTDFLRDTGASSEAITKMTSLWESHEASSRAISPKPEGGSKQQILRPVDTRLPRPDNVGFWRSFWTLTHRSWLKSLRDIMVYGARLVMYLGLAVLIGTVWLRVAPTQDNIRLFAYCILFGATFMSFMAVVYIPAFIEDYMAYIKDHQNGLCSAHTFLISNFVLGLPYLLAIALLFSIVAYWMVNFRPNGIAFVVWVLWTFLNLLAAESLVVLVSIVFPNFVGALALFAMTNSIFMACNGFMVPRSQLNVFYRYCIYYLNYQGYVFRGLSENEFGHRNYTCGVDCVLAGDAVFEQFGLEKSQQHQLIGIMIGIIAATRILSWAAMQLRHQMEKRHTARPG